MNDPGFVVKKVNKGEQIDLRGVHVIQVLPTECWIKPDGAKDDTPSFAFVLQDARDARVVFQISARMLAPVIREGQKILDEMGIK